MNDKSSVLVAEDEPALGRIIKENLETRNFVVELVHDGEHALRACRESPPDIFVLDLVMPKEDGFTVATEIRKFDKKTPTIFLTVKSQTKDVMEGFSVGGNDYLRKPFSMEELIVRIRNLLEWKTINERAEHLPLGDYIFNYYRQTLNFKNREKIVLTTREADLLYHLYQNRNNVLYRSPILLKLWGNDDFFSARSMDVFISKLRKKLAKDPNIEILNVRGYGYKLVF